MVSGRLPRNPPITDITQAMMRWEMPPMPINSPAKMKNGTAISANLSTLPNITWWTAVSGMSMKNRRMIAEVASRMMKIGKPRIRRPTGISTITHSIPCLPETLCFIFR